MKKKEKVWMTYVKEQQDVVLLGVNGKILAVERCGGASVRRSQKLPYARHSWSQPCSQQPTIISHLSL